MTRNGERRRGENGGGWGKRVDYDACLSAISVKCRLTLGLRSYGDISHKIEASRVAITRRNCFANLFILYVLIRIFTGFIDFAMGITRKRSSHIFLHPSGTRGRPPVSEQPHDSCSVFRELETTGCATFKATLAIVLPHTFRHQP